ncbi:GyrI-like domain-containing protein [Herbaspirillum sp. RV1423]|uniref:AraC family transcriptional regulator n=1 Tax=Herbaspirillum sp. RV1423 TaxID=1443993 RepID=UPI0004BC76DD|nr:GyrI-like domain-containing protein [Herbaspirillum sp. RV1423]
MNLRIVELPPARVAFLRHTGPYGPALGDFWRDTFIPWLQANHLDGPTCYGVGLDDPSSTPPEQCRYDACVEVPDGFVADSPAQVVTLPGGRYAVADFRGNARDIGAAWMKMCGEQMPGLGLQFDARPSFERYLPGSRTDPQTGLFSCEICVAVR